LPQFAFLVRARLPPDLEGLVRREGTPLVQESSGVCQGRFRRKRFFGDGLHASCAIRQGSTERVAWSSLLGSPLFVSIAIADHVRPVSQPSEARRRVQSDGVWPTKPPQDRGARGRPMTRFASQSFPPVGHERLIRARRRAASHHTEPRGWLGHGAVFPPPKHAPMPRAGLWPKCVTPPRADVVKPPLRVTGRHWHAEVHVGQAAEPTMSQECRRTHARGGEGGHMH
jgi:hypothetical protein